MKTLWREGRTMLWVGLGVGIGGGLVRLGGMTGGGNFLLGAAVLWIFLLLVFFRDPHRLISDDPQAIVAPADGRIVAIREENEPTYLKGPATKVSIFLSVMNVHVQRTPCAGTVDWIRHTPGKFFAAWKEEASIENERNAIGIRGERGNVLVHQVAGWIARRTVNWVDVGASLRAGDRLGMIKFGSRVDLYLPLSTALSVKVGDQVRGGRDVLGKFS